MNILLISECSGSALKETRRILDQFAERKGVRTWQTHITQNGLDTLRRLLRKTARRNTAVACHWLRKKNYSELIWIVGNTKRFDINGNVPTNITTRDILRTSDEESWQSIHGIKILASIAGLFHDLGKSSSAFQKLLRSEGSDYFRHEWVSLRLFQAFVNYCKDNKVFANSSEDNDDKKWLKCLENLTESENIEAKHTNYLKASELLENIKPYCCCDETQDGCNANLNAIKTIKSIDSMPTIAKTVMWLIVTHHKLPTKKNNDCFISNIFSALSYKDDYEKNNYNKNDDNNIKKTIVEWQKFWDFSEFDFKIDKTWTDKANYLAKEALRHKSFIDKDWLNDICSLHLSRLCLILADHYYSSHKIRNDKFCKENRKIVYANTCKDKDDKEAKKTDKQQNKAYGNQYLNEHLINVAKYAERISKTLPNLINELPRITRNKKFTERTEKERFIWQNKAYDVAVSLRDKSKKHGFFGINMASTGCGKTLANGKIMYGLADPAIGARFSIALGLRVLTLQTGDYYRNKLHLSDDDLATLIGSSVIKELHDTEKDQSNSQKEQQNDSLLEDIYVNFSGQSNIGLFGRWLENLDVKKILSSPVIVCTIDHLIYATECTRGGKHMTPMLRLLTSDLIIDEPDEFSVHDSYALIRLVHCAGMLGSKVLLSSATLPPDFVYALFEAYKEGRKKWIQSFGETDRKDVEAEKICCAWFDEQKIQNNLCDSLDHFKKEHVKFVETRVKFLQKNLSNKKAYIADILPAKDTEYTTGHDDVIVDRVVQTIESEMYKLHANNCNYIEMKSGKKIAYSCGLIRFANIKPLIEITKKIYQTNVKNSYAISLCCYHSQHILAVRSKIESILDKHLSRQNQEQHETAIKKEITKILEQSNQDVENVIFLVLASPVAEVGRDHDYDWAIVEPSSMRSIIQLAGRVRRHRVESYSKDQQYNICLLNENIKTLKNENDCVYEYPGYENKENKLQTKQLKQVLRESQYVNISSIPRIQNNKNNEKDNNCLNNLVDLEHKRMCDLHEEIKDWWEKPQATLCGNMQWNKQFRREKFEEDDERFFVFLNDDVDDNNGDSHFNFKDIYEGLHNSRFEESKEQPGNNVYIFGGYNDYFEIISELSENKNLSMEDCCKKFCFIDLKSGWMYRFHDVFGFWDGEKV